MNEQLRIIEGESTRSTWEKLWEKDSWRQWEVPNGDLSSAYRGNRKINFGRIKQPWLKECTKRFAKDRLMTGTGVQSVLSYAADIAAFSEWLSATWPEVSSPPLLTREVLEDYMAHVRMSDLKPATKARHVGSVRKLIREQREDGLRGLPHSAKIHARELPPTGGQNYKPPSDLLDEFVIQQIVDPRNLALIETHHQTWLLILAETGMRISSMLELKRDCVSRDSTGASYITYLNVKGQRESGVPISDKLAAQIDAQLAWLEERGLEGDFLFPGMNHSQTDHVSHSTVRRAIKLYISKADIRDEKGNLADYTRPHLFRHQVGTSLVNQGVSLDVVARVLDHKSLEMTAHYARIHDSTIREEMDKFHQRVNARGEYIALPVTGPLSDAHWKKERIARAKQALPNGYCGRPIVDECPHPNACLDCESFLTDETFLPIHLEQQAQTVRLIEEHEALGHERIVKNLRSDLSALNLIIEGLEAIQVDPTELEKTAEFDLRKGLGVDDSSK